MWTTFKMALLIGGLAFSSAAMSFSHEAGKQPDAAKSERLKVGLVLGGGGAKGAAEVGVLKVIEQVGIPIDYIAGTSIGAIIGGLYATGHSAAEIDTMFRSQKWLSLLTDRNEYRASSVISTEDSTTYVLGFPIGRKPRKRRTIGIMRGDHIVHLLDSMTGQPDSINFDHLPIPFRCVAADMKNRKEVVLRNGHLAMCMRASMAIPGAFKPVVMDSLVLYDGGMLNNLPVDVVRAMGADVVIAIDLTQNKREARDFSLRETLGIGGIMDWMVSRPDLVKYNQNRRNAEVYINPNLSGYGASSFSKQKIAEMMNIGERTAIINRKSLEKLKKRVELGVR